MNNKYYLRASTFFGLFNTLWGCLLDRLLVRIRDTETGWTTDCFWDCLWPTATASPPEETKREVASNGQEVMTYQKWGKLLREWYDGQYPLVDNPLLDPEQPMTEILVTCASGCKYRLLVNP